MSLAVLAAKCRHYSTNLKWPSTKKGDCFTFFLGPEVKASMPKPMINFRAVPKSIGVHLSFDVANELDVKS